jgi:DNA-binding transcriptional LysR family regulator
MRTFLRVAELGSVRQAAAELHVTEPAVSAAIGEVARALGVALFVKAGRGIELTEAGRTYADYVRSLLGLAAEATAAVRSA